MSGYPLNHLLHAKIRTMKSLYLFPTLLLALVFAACTNDQLVEIAPLEHDLLITWIALERGDSAIARRHQLAASVKWERLLQKYRTGLLTEAEKRSVGMVNLWINNLDVALTHDQSQTALVTILHLQNQLKTLRPRYGITHPADLLYEFNYDWGRVRETYQDQMMCLLEWKEFVGIYEQASVHWQNFQRAQPAHADLVFPGLGTNSTTTEYSALALTQALNNFGQYLEQADHTIMAGPGEEVRSAFLEYVAVVVAYPGREL